MKKRIQPHELSNNIKKGDTLRGVCNIGIPNTNGTYGTIQNGSYYEKRTSGGNFSNFTYDGGIINMFWNGLSGENIDLSLVGTGLVHRMSGNGSDQRHYVTGALTENPVPRYLERLTQLSTNTSPITKNSLQ